MSSPMADRLARTSRRTNRQARQQLGQDLTRDQLENLNQQLRARWTADQRQRAQEAEAQEAEAQEAAPEAETVKLVALSNTAQNGGMNTPGRFAPRMGRLPSRQTRRADPDGFTSVGASAAGAAAALARTRAIVQAKQRERQEAQQREYAGLLAAFHGACARCFDTGAVWGSSGFCDCARGTERRQAAQARVSERILEAAQVPAEYAQASLATFPRQDIARALEAWAQGWDQRQGLILVGPVGVGKTTLLAAALRRLVELEAARDLETPLRYRFMDTADWLVNLRAGQDDGTYADYMDMAQTYGLWVLDDLGRTAYTAWEQGQLWGALKARCDHHRGLFATTNLSPQELGERLSPAVLDRLQSSCLWVTVTGKSMRRSRASLAF